MLGLANRSPAPGIGIVCGFPPPGRGGGRYGISGPIVGRFPPPGRGGGWYGKEGRNPSPPSSRSSVPLPLTSTKSPVRARNPMSRLTGDGLDGRSRPQSPRGLAGRSPMPRLTGPGIMLCCSREALSAKSATGRRCQGGIPARGAGARPLRMECCY